MHGKKLRVLLVDDHDVVHLGLRLLLTGQQWVERFLSAHDPDEALALARKWEPHVALVDLFIGADSGAELCEHLQEASARTRILLISGAGTISPRAARAVGASGFVSKGWSGHDIAAAVRMVGYGMSMFRSEGRRTAETSLSARETDVLRLIAGGATNREIADQLFLSLHTVKDYTKALYRKVGARNRVEAVTRADRLGLLAEAQPIRLAAGRPEPNPLGPRGGPPGRSPPKLGTLPS